MNKNNIYNKSGIMLLMTTIIEDNTKINDTYFSHSFPCLLLTRFILNRISL